MTKTMKKKRALWRKLRNILLPIAFAIIIVPIVTFVIGTDKVQAVQNNLDVNWWMLTIIRLFVMVLVAFVFLPWMLRRKCLQMEHEIEYWQTMLSGELTDLERQDAQFYLEQTSVKSDLFNKLATHPVYIFGVLFVIECVIVQLPHWL